MTAYITSSDALEFVKTLEDESVSLYLIDPPYMDIVEDSWDNQWKKTEDYVKWMFDIFSAIKPKMKKNGSILFFGGIGKHGNRPFFDLLRAIEDSNLFVYRNLICWQKRKAYGKSHDYLFCREEIAWYSMSPVRTEVTFNIPLTNIKRGYGGWNKKYQAKSEYKRVSNVWTDIPELMRPKRNTQKPVPLIERLIQTHSNPGDLVVDTFCGWGTTGIAAIQQGRRFLGCERIPEDAIMANERCLQAKQTITTQPIISV
jgi:site-specific DNA-methyltransferase (adenine-specific)